jgi:hypothetical protein
VAPWSAPLLLRQSLGLAAIAAATGIALGGFAAHVAGSPPEPPAPNDAVSKSPTPPTASEKMPVPKKRTVGSKTLERILANWKAREERTRSLYFEWENREFFGKAEEARRKGKAAQPGPRSRRVSEWREGFDRRRFDTLPLLAPAPNPVVAGVKTRIVSNGSTRLSVEDWDKVAGWPVATYSPSQKQSLVPRSSGLTLAFYALHAFEINSPSPQFRVISEDVLTNGSHCVELENANAEGTEFENCWVDPARDDVVVAYEFRLQLMKGRQPSRTVAIEYQRDRVYGWVPTHFTARQPGWHFLSEVTVTKYTINEPFPKDTFSLNVPTGTIVFDERSSERYRAAAGRGKIDVVKFDSRPSLRIGEALEARSDFPIEPQSLKDALNVIADRYGIGIFVHPAETEAVGFTPPVQVGPLPAGIKVADLLKMLLAKCPEPIGFRIEDEVLKISPRFKEQGGFGARPAPAPQVPESPEARKIRETLEMPVDFMIERQALGDALEFIRARYQIKIEVQRDAPFDKSAEVKNCFPGIKLKSLLTILLEQLPGQVGFKIEGDVLKIYSTMPAS